MGKLDKQQSVAKVQEVFVTSGTPTITYIEPQEYGRLRVALDTPGKGVVLEGPSGIGKTTLLRRTLEDLAAESDDEFEMPPILSARRAEDVNSILEYLRTDQGDDLIVDDFHRLPQNIKAEIADRLKVRADERSGGKIVLIGINEAGKTLIGVASDLDNRLERIKMGRQSDEAIRTLVERGEAALNIELACADEIIRACQGSFYVAQMLCSRACIAAKVFRTEESPRKIDLGYGQILAEYMSERSGRFDDKLIRFVKGKKFRRTSRAPYYWVLRWLGESSSEELNVAHRMQLAPDTGIAVRTILNNNYIGEHTNSADFADLFYFDEARQTLGVEDPQLLFYLRNLDWDAFYEKAGFESQARETKKYDFALSFSGKVCRGVARRVFVELTELDYSVFFDEDAQPELLGRPLREQLQEAYRNAEIVVPIIDDKYGSSIWTLLEKEVFESNIGTGEVVPILVNREGTTGFDKTHEIACIDVKYEDHADTLESSSDSPMSPDVAVVCSSLVKVLNRQLKES